MNGNNYRKKWCGREGDEEEYYIVEEKEQKLYKLPRTRTREEKEKEE